MFTQRISMDCTKEQYKKFLKDELLKMGYREDITFANEGFGYVISNGIDNGLVADLWFENRTMDEEHYLGSFNAPLFLALAAMTDKPDILGYGEYVIRESDFRLVRNDWGTQKFEYNGWRKATKEEIMAKFGNLKRGNITFEVTIDAKEILSDISKALEVTETEIGSINLLKSKGYKILKPKTWEEV